MFSEFISEQNRGGVFPSLFFATNSEFFGVFIVIWL